MFTYTGGLGTFPQQIRPWAYYVPEAGEGGRTYFTYGGSTESSPTHLLHMVSYYDHATGQVANPRILLDKSTTDGHDNPAILVDEAGYIYIYSNAHGTSRPSYIHRGTQPYGIDEFEEVVALSGASNFSYSQPWYVDGQGTLFLYTHYDWARNLYYNRSTNGTDWDYAWDAPAALAQIPGGQYSISGMGEHTVGSAFNINAQTNRRTNLYYLETSDLGDTWRTADGTSLTLPLTTVNNAALVHDYASEGLYVYLKDLEYDAQDRPILLYLTTSVVVPEISSVDKTWYTAFWSDDEDEWIIREAFISDQNYDHGELTIEDDGTWRIIAPTDPGPAALRTGGDMVMWTSRDQGLTWDRIATLTHDSQYNHMYARGPVRPHDDFYALWADGDTSAVSHSSLYFTDKYGTGVWRLPLEMEGDFATPELAFVPLLEWLPGDLNDDGVVNGDDLDIVRSFWGQTVPQGDPAWGDPSGDGFVGGDDLDIVRTYWGRAISPPAVTVPEPSTLATLLTLCLAVVLPRHLGACFAGC